MPKAYTVGYNVYEAAKDRLRGLWNDGHRLVFALSGGKDSTVVMELAIEVARELGKLPIEVITRDEEIMYPGTYEYLERVYQRPEVDFTWMIAGQPIINSYNRWLPYFWVFDPLEKDKWLRQPPAWAQWIPIQNIDGMITLERFPPPDGKRLISVNGLRAAESFRRMTRIAGSRGPMTVHPSPYGAYKYMPIYDWTDDDVWHAIYTFGWDYNKAYDAMFRIGVPKRLLRIAPPSMRQGFRSLSYAINLWPSWFDKLTARLPGIKLAAHYGQHALRPYLKDGETWEDCTYRLRAEAIEHGAMWMVERMDHAITKSVEAHGRHSSEPFPQTSRKGCKACPPTNPGSWQRVAYGLYDGDPWGDHFKWLSTPLEPTVFRSDARPWFEDGKKGALGW